MNEVGRADGRVVCVVVTYNGMAWLDRCLGSLIASSAPVHVIVVDNGSTDGTVDHIRRAFPEVELIPTAENLGFGRANNVGLRLALDRGAGHVFLLNQDAWVQPETIAELIRAAREHPTFGVISPMHLNGTGTALDGNFSSYIIPARCPGLYSDLVLGHPHDAPYPVQFVNAAAWLITRNCLETVGGFNPSFFHYGEDDNYLARMHFHGLKAGVMPSAWIHHDREQRNGSPHFEDFTTQVRKALITYSDPACRKHIKVEVNKLRRTMIQCLCSAQRTAFRTARRHYRVLQAMDAQVVERNREVSRLKGPSFL